MKRCTLIILGAVVLIAVATFYFVRAAETRVTDDMVARAGRIAIPPDWKKTTDIVRGEMFLCMGTNPCPSIQWTWNTGKELSMDDLKAAGSSAGLEPSIRGTCQRQPHDIGPATVCDASGTDGEYDYSLNVTSPAKAGPQVAVLIVRPHQ